MTNQNQDSRDEDCPACFGIGHEVAMRSPWPVRKILPVPCPECGGTGRRSEPRRPQ